ncbi:MAG: M81 family metallopeptidase [Alphaproteobacteria bacterium]|nr:M81 family metallopeptidase [Alphaproteobacteria bacterium]
MPTVLTAEFSHESNTFSVRKTGLPAFMDRSYHIGDAAIRERGDANTPLAGFLDVGRARGWRMIHTVSASAQPAGPVTREAFDTIAKTIVEGARMHRGGIDGILLGLHGAMVTADSEDGEGELLERLRAVVGPELPIAITLDPHANVTRRMCALAQIIVSYKTYPHVDMRERGRQAAEVLGRTMADEIRPTTLRAHRPMLEEVNGGRTDVGLMVSLLDRARAYEKDPDVFVVSINGGFGTADIAEVGPTVLVTAQGDMARHRAFAESLADEIWNHRFDVRNDYMSVDAAAALCRDYAGTGGPLIVADYADNPGGGAYGDSTELLRALLAAGVRDCAFGPIVDGEAAAELHRLPVGATTTIRLGGKTDARFGGGPLELRATVLRLSDGAYVGDGPMIGGLRSSWGPTAVIKVDDIEILVATVPQQMLDLQQFRAFGIDPAAKRVVGLKSMQHFRAAFEPIAGKVIVCDSGALCTPDLARLPYRNVPRPIFPLDPDLALA